MKFDYVTTHLHLRQKGIIRKDFQVLSLTTPIGKMLAGNAISTLTILSSKLNCFYLSCSLICM